MRRLLTTLTLIVCLSIAPHVSAQGLLPNAEQTFVDDNGAPLVGGLVYFYVPGTTTLKNTWKDSGLTTLNTNPVQLDAAGRAIIFGAGQYRQVVNDALGNLVWDQITSSAGGDSVPQVATNAALKALPAGAYSSVLRTAWATAGDGGHALYYWSAASTATEDGGSVVAPNAGAGRWLLLPSYPLNSMVWNVTSSPINFYVSTTGSDRSGANYCIVSTAPCRTATQAVTQARKFNAAGGNVQVNLAAGSYAESVAVNYPLSGAMNSAANPGGTNNQPGQLMLSGAGSGTTTLTASGLCGTVIASDYATVGVRAIKLMGNAAGCQSTLFAQLAGTINIYDDVNFGAASVEHIHVENAGSSVQAWYSYTVSGGAQRHVLAAQGGLYLHSAYPSGVITLSGTPAFSVAFVDATSSGTVQFNSGVTFSGTFTGPRFSATDNGTIQTYPSTSLTWLPGSVAGSAAGGGVYHGPTSLPVTGAVKSSGLGQYTQAGCGDLADVLCGNATWTPTVAFGGASVGITYGTRIGLYQRIDKGITVWFDVTLTSKGASVGSAGIAGLPFAGYASAAQPCTIGYYDNMATITSFQGSYVNSGASSVSLVGPGAATIAAYTDANFTNTTRITGRCTYATN